MAAAAAAGGHRETISITFGDRAENHAGMQIIGDAAAAGFTRADLDAARARLAALGCRAEVVALHPHLPAAHVPAGGRPEAHVLVARRAVTPLLAAADAGGTADDLLREQAALEVDKRAKMRGRVVTKRARWNVCFGEAAQEPDYEAGKGRVVAFADVPLLGRLRAALRTVLGEKARGLQGELNKYYDVAECGIGFHGDSERKIVACARLGATIPLHYQWFVEGAPVGPRGVLSLGHGDFYVMSEKATGCDWKRRKVPTLRHAAGAAKFLRIKQQPAPELVSLAAPPAAAAAAGAAAEAASPPAKRRR